MAKRHDLKRKLKAADRRRSRRPTAAASPRPTVSAPKVDVTALITSDILSCEMGDQPRDAVAIAALRGCLRGNLPSQDPARSLATKLNDLTNHPEVSMRAYRSALQQLLDVAAQHEASESPDAFLRYLSIISPS